MESELFAGIDEAELPAVLSYLSARIVKYKKDELILTAGEPVDPCIILSGSVKLSLYTEDNRSELKDSHFAGMSFGIPTACAGENISAAYMFASGAVEILHMDFSVLIDVPHTDLPHFHAVLVGNVIRYVSNQTMINLKHLRVISYHKIRSRILAYLYDQERNEDGTIDVHLSMQDLALYLNSDRSYLYKEIASLKKDGILEWNGRRVKLLQTPKL